MWVESESINLEPPRLISQTKFLAQRIYLVQRYRRQGGINRGDRGRGRRGKGTKERRERGKHQRKRLFVLESKRISLDREDTDVAHRKMGGYKGKMRTKCLMRCLILVGYVNLLS